MFPANPRRQPLPDEGRPAAPRTAAARRWTPNRTSTSSSAGGSRRHAVGRREGPEGDEDQRVPRTPRAAAARASSSSPCSPTTTTARSKTSPAGAVREQRHGNRASSTSARAGEHARHERRGGGDGPLPGDGRRVPRYRAAGREDSRLDTSPRRLSWTSLPTKKWKELGLVPSELCSDEQFVRRVYVDITGTLPTPKDVLAFVDDKDPRSATSWWTSCSTRRSTPTSSRTSGPTSSA